MCNYLFEITDDAQNDLDDLPQLTAERIVKKLKFFSKAPDPFKFADTLTDSEIGGYRFRIGEYRASFDVEYTKGAVILNILRIKHRREIYR